MINTDIAVFSDLQTKIAAYVVPIKDLVVDSKEVSDSAAEAFRTLKKMEKAVEDKRVETVRPHNNHVDKINEFAKQVKAPIIKALAHITDQQKGFERILEKQREEARRIEREEQAKREEEARAIMKANAEAAAAKIQALKEEAEVAAMFEEANAEEAQEQAKAQEQALLDEQRIENERIAFEVKKTHWDASKEIKSNKVQGVRRTWKGVVIDESLVPHEYFSIDQVKINKAVTGGAREIPGVKISEEISITGR